MTAIKRSPFDVGVRLPLGPREPRSCSKEEGIDYHFRTSRETLTHAVFGFLFFHRNFVQLARHDSDVIS